MKELVVISPLHDWTCRDCQGSGDFLTTEGQDRSASPARSWTIWSLLGAGDAALTRRAKAARKLWAVMIRFSSPALQRY